MTHRLRTIAVEAHRHTKIREDRSENLTVMQDQGKSITLI